jgi:hypothetical protein
MIATEVSRKRLSPPPWLRWGVFLLLAGYLLFSHGCHGNEDNELFAVVRSAFGQ